MGHLPDRMNAVPEPRARGEVFAANGCQAGDHVTGRPDLKSGVIG